MYRNHVRSITLSLILSALFGIGVAGSAEESKISAAYPEWCVYMTAGSVEQLAADPNEVAVAVERMRALGITKAYVEVYRGGVVSPEALMAVRDALRAEGFDVAGGIATVPGGGYGVRQDGPLGWFNWQNPKTQHDMREVTAMAAGIFDEFIVDDFFCTGDTSEESNVARGDRTWSEYRRDLLVGLATSLFIEPARSVNPDITMIIKYPQWYDKFHEYGYDVAGMSPLFDEVWVGTETRGASTQRFGFTQAYMGFVNYRWIASIAGERIAGAWFDHLDCDADDFVEQAYQTILAGAPSVILFNYAEVRDGHGGHPLLVRERDRLQQLAETVKRAPVVGVAAYKPVNSDGGSDMFVMDTIGMLGVPLAPMATWPEEANVVFLPAQAAADPEITRRINAAVQSKKTVIVTAGLLNALDEASDVARLAGVEVPAVETRVSADAVVVGDETHTLARPLDLAAELAVTTATPLLMATVDGRPAPIMTRNETDGAQVLVLNVRTYSQEDYDAVEEVLLPPHPLGLLELPRAVVNVLRTAFNAPLGIDFDAGPRVTLQTLADGSAVIQNYENSPQEMALTLGGNGVGGVRDAFGEAEFIADGDRVRWTMPPRSRVWLSTVK